jgi:glycerophosphoryl diester phosphodiesterase
MPLRILRYCLLGIIFLFSVGAVPYFSAGVMTYYNRFQTRQEETLRRVHGQRTVRHADRKRRHVLAVCVSIAMLLMDLTYLYRIVSGDVSLRFVLTVEPMVIAHRGASTKAPENTAYAFYKAMELGADGIELDIQQTADGVLVVTHDQNLKRISGWNQKISEVTYAELQDLDVGSWFQPIYQNARLMTLEEVFQLTDGTVFLNIELKSDAVGENLEEKVADLILQYGMENRCCVTSFSYQVLKKIKACDPEIQTGFLMNHAYGDFYDLEAADVFSIRSVFITQKIVDNAHENGKEIYAWTVNTVPEMQRMLNLSVDHIITDKPELLQAQINRDSTEDTLLATVLRLIS